VRALEPSWRLRIDIFSLFESRFKHIKLIRIDPSADDVLPQSPNGVDEDQIFRTVFGIDRKHDPAGWLYRSAPFSAPHRKRHGKMIIPSAVTITDRPIGKEGGETALDVLDQHRLSPYIQDNSPADPRNSHRVNLPPSPRSAPPHPPRAHSVLYLHRTIALSNLRF
jgi:hypothetical protein